MTYQTQKAQAGLQLPRGKTDFSSQSFNEVKHEMQKKKKNQFHIPSISIEVEVFLRKYVLAMKYFNGMKVCWYRPYSYPDVPFVLKGIPKGVQRPTQRALKIKFCRQTFI